MREQAFEDAEVVYRSKSFDPTAPFSVEFIGEVGVDGGGLQREMACHL